ncbi:abnormal spindle-like microcephaly-associated protein homolog [Anabrus simplex]|uniref:abnormal spindle-like microcephaly-associated protein homolog n=1 Tax=Anabrus simplex TaxID=316456 RepID=UPI0035A26A77
MAASSFFEVDISSRNKVQQVEQDDAAVLILAPFTKAPRLIFNDVKLGDVVKKPITIQNPSDVTVQVELVKLPAPDKGLVFSATRLQLQPYSAEVIEAIWTPLKEGSWRFAVGVKTSCTLKMDIIINCTSVRKKPVQKKGPQRRWAPSLPTKSRKNRSPKYQSPKIGLKIEKKSPLSSVTPLARRRQTFLLSRSKLSPYLPDASTRRQPGIQNSPSPLVKVSTYSKETYESVISCSQKKIPQERRAEQEDFLTPVRSPMPRFKLGGACTIGRRNLSSRLHNSGTPDINAALDKITFSPIVQPSVNVCFNKDIPPETQDSLQTKLLLDETPAALRRATFDVFPPTSEIPVSEQKIITKGLDDIPEISVETSTGDSEVSRDSLDECKSHNISSETYSINKSPCNLQDVHDLFPDKMKLSPEVVSHNSQISSRMFEPLHSTNYCTTASINLDRYISPVVGKSNISPVKPGNENPAESEFHLLNDVDIENVLSQFAECHSSDPVGYSLSSAQTRKPDFRFSPLHRQKTEISPPQSSFQNYLFHQPLSHLEHSERHFSASISDQFSFQNEKHRPDIFRLNDSSLSQADKWGEVSFWQPTKLSPLDLSCKKHVLPQSVLSNVAEDFCSSSDIVEAVQVEDNKLLHRSSATQSGEVEAFTTRNFARSLNFGSNDFSSSKVGTLTSPQRKGLRDLTNFDYSDILSETPRNFNSDKPLSVNKTVQNSDILSETQENLSFEKPFFFKEIVQESEMMRTAKVTPIVRLDFSPPKKTVKADKSSPVRIKTHCTNTKGVAPQTDSILRGRKRKSGILPVSHLILSAKKACKPEKSVRYYDPDGFLSNITNPKHSIATSIVNPFLSSSVYYDGDWYDLRIKEFIKWLNYLLTPPAQLSSSDHLPRVDVAELWSRSCKEEVAPAPSREVVSSLYHINHRLDSLRKAAYSLFQSSHVASVLSKVIIQVDKGILAVRDDRNIHLDIGLKQSVLKLLLCYNPLWLRIGLETIYGKTVPMQSNSDAVSLVAFIANYFLSDPYLVQQYSVKGVLHTFKPGFGAAMKKFILKKFLFLVYFLDYAKEKKLISHDPCLFCKDAMYKESREILLAFARDLLSGIGDITKHLRNVGYLVKHKQTYLHEYNYAVSSLESDLRDGVRLVRVMEIILQKPDLCTKLRTPAISRLQKIHNVQVALGALLEAGYTLEGNIAAKDIVEGHKEKTLSLLWQIIYKFQVSDFDVACELFSNWWHHFSNKLEIQHFISLLKLAPHFNAAATKIQVWWRKNALKVRINQLIRIRKALKAKTDACVIIQKHWRAFMQKKKYQRARSVVIKMQKRWRSIQLTRRLRSEYLAKREVIIKLQSVCRGYIFRKNFQTCREMSAAYYIQTWYRKKLALRRINAILITYEKYREETKKRHNCAIKIQAWYRSMMKARKLVAISSLYKEYCEETKERQSAAIKIQNWYRRMVAARTLIAIGYIHEKYCEETKMKNLAVAKIQIWYRRAVEARKLEAICLLYKNYCVETKRRHSAAAIIQRWYRRAVEARKLEAICSLYKNYCVETKIRHTAAAAKIQRWYRRAVEARKLEAICSLYKNYCVETKRRHSAAAKIQRWYRRAVEARKLEAICSLYKNYCVETKIRHTAAAAKIQRWYCRAVEARKLETICSLYKNYCVETKIRHTAAAAKIQRWYRRAVEARKLEAVCSLYKNYCVETKRRHSAAARIQSWYRRTVEARKLEAICSLYKNYCVETKIRHTAAAAKIQSWYRRAVEARKLEAICTLYKNYCVETKRRHTAAAAKIQRWYRRAVEARKLEAICSLYKNYCVETKRRHSAAARIQSWYRRAVEARKLEAICSLYKNYCVETKIRHTAAAAKIQRWYRRAVEARKLEAICSLYKNYCVETKRRHTAAATEIQRWYRRAVEARKLEAICSLYKNYCVETKRRHTAAAAKIQRWYRRAVEARKLEAICSLYKNYCVETKRRHTAAAKIQSWYRRAVEARKLEAICSLYKNYCVETKRRHSAAAKIQSWYRRAVEARKLEAICTLYKNYCVETKRRHSAAAKIQSWYRRAVEARKLEAICTLYKNYCVETKIRHTAAAAKIQRWYRRAVEARKLEAICLLYNSYCVETKRRHTAAAAKIQRWYRRAVEARKLEAICSLYKNYCVETKRRHTAAAAKIQRWYRRAVEARKLEAICSLYKNYCVETKRRYTAAAKIQSWYRRAVEARKLEAICSLYKNYCVETKTRHSAAAKIQRWYRRAVEARTLEAICSLYKNYCVETKRRHSAAAKIQRWYRRAVEARKLEAICLLYNSYCVETKRRHTAAAAKIQRWYRRAVEARKLEAICSLYMNYCVETKRRHSAAAKIQSWYRRAVEARKLEAICTLYRIYCAEMKRRHSAAAKIQIWYGQVLVGRKLNVIRSLYEEYCEEAKNRNRAVVKIQIWYRRMMEARKLDYVCELYKNYCLETRKKNCAAAKIQTWYRKAMKVRKLRAICTLYSNYCEKMERRHHAAAKIQIWYRQVLMNRKLNAIRNLFEDYYVEINRRKRAAARIQTWYRNMVYCRRLNAIIFLYKSYLNDVQERKVNQMKMLIYYNDPCYMNAAVVIQKHFRRFLQQKKYKCVLKATLCIQRHWRGMLQTRDNRELFLKIRTSVVKLQACWRAYLVRRDMGLNLQEKNRQLGYDHSLRERYTTVLNNWMPTKTFGELLVFVQVVDTVTRLSRELSEEFSANHLRMLFLTIDRCNRSVPASHVLEYATSVLVNLVKHEDSMKNVWKDDLVKVLLRLMAGWCGKSCAIFCNCCTVLWLLAQDPQKATAILETENVKSMLLKFYDSENSRSKREKKASHKVVSEAKVNKCKLPDITPEWKILKRKRPRTFQDPFFAVTSLLIKLGLKKKKEN